MSAHLNETPAQVMHREEVINKIKMDFVLPSELVFDKEQRFDKLKEVYTAEKENLKEIFGQNALEIHQVGSTAIRGMPGTRAVDIAVIVQSWPPTDEESAKMKKIGYQNLGASPHFEGDHWYWKQLGHNDFGDTAVHVVRRDNIGIDNMLAFVEYCNAVPEAAEKFKQMKLEESAGSDFMKYKMEKGKKMQPLIQEAWEWKQKQKDA